MKCKYCGRDVTSGASYCPHCGKSLVKKPVNKATILLIESGFYIIRFVFSGCKTSGR